MDIALDGLCHSIGVDSRQTGVDFEKVVVEKDQASNISFVFGPDSFDAGANS